MQILLASTQINNNRSSPFSILLRTVQSETSYITYSFLFFVVRLVVIYERLAKTLQFFKEIHDDAVTLNTYNRCLRSFKITLNISSLSNP